MKNRIAIIFTLIAFNTVFGQTENATDYIEFDDRKNIVHGVYVGANYHYGKINHEDAFFSSYKLAYVANKKLEIGLAATFFFSEQPDELNIYESNKVALFGGYVGLHVEPILLSNRFVNISFPIIIGQGYITVLDKKENGDYVFEDGEGNEKRDSSNFFALEPGINILYNISRYAQIETGIRYRITGKYNLLPFRRDNLNGFSAGIGLKLGIFNMGRKKKAIKDDFH